MKVGLIGAENFHSRAFSDIFNRRKLFPGFEITAIYGGDDPEKCMTLCEEFGISQNCGSEQEVIDSCDAVMITYRRGSMHAAPAIAALRAGKPVFIDKPFTCDVTEAQRIVDIARETGTPFCGGSTLKNLPVIDEIRRVITPGCTVSIDYNADPESPFGGFYFYGAHAAELCLILCGEDYSEVHSRRAGQEIVTAVTYPDKQCVLITSPIKEDLDIRVSGARVQDFKVTIDEAYRYKAEVFVQMCRDGKLTRDPAYYVKTVSFMDEIVKSYTK